MFWYLILCLFFLQFFSSYIKMHSIPLILKWKRKHLAIIKSNLFVLFIVILLYRYFFMLSVLEVTYVIFLWLLWKHRTVFQKYFKIDKNDYKVMFGTLFCLPMFALMRKHGQISVSLTHDNTDVHIHHKFLEYHCFIFSLCRTGFRK